LLRLLDLEHGRHTFAENCSHGMRKMTPLTGRGLSLLTSHILPLTVLRIGRIADVRRTGLAQLGAIPVRLLRLVGNNLLLILLLVVQAGGRQPSAVLLWPMFGNPRRKIPLPERVALWPLTAWRRLVLQALERLVTSGVQGPLVCSCWRW
jgi:hypothetical protein